MLKFIEAVLLLSGMIIGVGMFGIPFSFVKAGFLLGALELIILTAVILTFHLLYGEIAMATPTPHQLPGYVRIYLGAKASFLAWASAIFGIIFTLLAYTVVGSAFLKNIIFWFDKSASDSWLAVFLVLLGAAVTALPLKKETLINSILTALLVIFIVTISVILMPHVGLKNLGGFDARNVLLPYGVLLFALSGGVVIPELVLFLGKDRRRIRSAITVGTLLPACLYFIFALAVTGATGSATSEEAIRGLGSILGGNFVFLGSIIGFLAVFTSLIAMSTSFQELLSFDLGLPNFLSWFLSAAVPLVLYFSGFHSFIIIIAAVGALAVGIDSALVVASEHRLRERGGVTLSWRAHTWRLGIYGMVALGAIYQLFKVFMR